MLLRDLIKKCIKLHDCIESGRYMGLSRYLHVATVDFFSKLRFPPREQAELLRSEKCVVVAIRSFC